MGDMSVEVAASGQPLIDLRDVSQQVGTGELILRGISLSIGRGELVAIIGGSGTGKTTLLDTMWGSGRPRQARSTAMAGQNRHGYVPARRHHSPEPAAAPHSALHRRVRAARGHHGRADGASGNGCAQRPPTTRPRRRAGRLAVRRSAQARQHRRRTADQTRRLFPGRADVGATSPPAEQS